MKKLIKEAEENLTVSNESAEEYEKKKDSMLNFVNTEIAKKRFGSVNWRELFTDDALYLAKRKGRNRCEIL